MPRHAFILGGTGQIGRAAACALVDRGWTVTLASRHGGVPDALTERAVVGAALDREAPDALARALGEGADLLLDTVAYDAGHAGQLIEAQHHVGHLVAISSASVYRDAAGRTLDEAGANGFPELPERMTEGQPTVEPGPATYSTRKVAMERRLLDGARGNVTVVRPCAIHGPHSRHAREWWFVKRVLDGRRRIPLAYMGASRLHTSAVANIAALIIAAAEAGGARVLNAVDPEPPSVAEIGRAVLSVIGVDAALVPVPDAGYPPSVGASPWSVPRPFTLSDAAARAIGYAPVGGYAETIAQTARWLASGAAGQDWRAAFPQLAAYPWDLFDYAREDRRLDGGR